MVELWKWLEENIYKIWTDNFKHTSSPGMYGHTEEPVI